MSDLFQELEEAERRKELGMAAAASTSEEWLTQARRWAAAHSARHGAVSAADVRFKCEEHNFWPPSENAWGSLFKAPGWEHVGYTKAKHKSGHARTIMTWKYVSTGAHLR